MARPSRVATYQWCLAQTQQLRRTTQHAYALVLPVPPSGNRAWRVGKFGQVYEQEATRHFKAIVDAVCGAIRMTPMEADVALSIMWYRSARQGDVDNRQKVLLDALAKHVYLNDRQVACLRIERLDGASIPHLTVMAYPWATRNAENTPCWLVSDLHCITPTEVDGNGPRSEEPPSSGAETAPSTNA